ncbi:MAG: class I adenylate-forming enzyme family protein [Egibacteraceae bacterium]
MKEFTPTARSNFDHAHTYRGIPFEVPVAHPSTILTHLANRARENGGDPYLTTVAADGQSATLTYGELDVRTRQAAAWLRRELGVSSEDVVGLLPVNDMTSVITIFGLLRAGCAVMVLSSTDPIGRLREQTAALPVKAIVRPGSLGEEVFPGSVVAPDLMALADEAADANDPIITPLADALFFGTSGSTAASKLVTQSHYNAAINADAVRRHHGLAPGDRFLGCLPIHHVNGLHFTILATLATGSHAILAHAFDPFGYPRLIERFRPRIASVVPTILETLVETWRRPAFPTEFDYFVSAAAPLTASTVAAVDEKLGARVLQGYGLTEATNFSTTMPAGVLDELYRRLMLDADIPSIGVALHGNEVAVLNSDGQRVRPGEVGEICMRGHNVMTSYAGNDEATTDAFQGGWFHSQDLGFEVKDSESGSTFFTVTGRSKNIAKVMGETVSLDEMDRVLRAVPGVKDAACVCIPDRFLGDEIVAAVVLSPGRQDVDVRAHLSRAFAPALLPRRTVYVAALPRTSTGKLRRPQLGKALASAQDA